jgi:hypothetical protein
MCAYDKEIAEKYRFKFVGFEDDTAQQDVALRQAQSTTFASMNYLLGTDNREKINHPIADIPLNQSFWALCNQMMTKGEIRETFLGDKGASKRPELQYISGDPAFMSWQQMLLSVGAQKKQMAQQDEQAKAQQEQQEHDKQLQLQQEGREQEQHDLQVDQHKDQQASSVVNYSQQLHDTAKQFGATSASHIGGKVLKNPLNQFSDEE